MKRFTITIAALAAASALIYFSGVADDFTAVVHAIERNWPGIVGLFSFLGVR